METVAELVGVPLCPLRFLQESLELLLCGEKLGLQLQRQPGQRLVAARFRIGEEAISVTPDLSERTGPEALACLPDVRYYLAQRWSFLRWVKLANQAKKGVSITVELPESPIFLLITPIPFRVLPPLRRERTMLISGGRSA